MIFAQTDALVQTTCPATIIYKFSSHTHKKSSVIDGLKMPIQEYFVRGVIMARITHGLDGLRRLILIHPMTIHMYSIHHLDMVTMVELQPAYTIL